MSGLTDIRYDNYTLYGIQSKTERHLLIGYTSLISISSLIGDTLILVGSSRYNAIKLHKIMVVFIQHIAVADLAFSLFKALPGAVSLAANDWILGRFLCFAAYYATYISALAMCLHISALALAKLLIVRDPLRAINFSSKTGHMIACGIWVYSAIFPIAATIKEKFDIYFSYLDYNCESYGEWKPLENLIYSSAVGFSILASDVVTLVSSVMLIHLAKKATERGLGELQWRGIATVLLTVAVHIVSTLPLAVYFVGSAITSSTLFQVEFHRYALYIALFDTMANFYIYTLTLRSFREFLKSRICVGSSLSVGSRALNKDRTITTDAGESERLLT